MSQAAAVISHTRVRSGNWNAPIVIFLIWAVLYQYFARLLHVSSPNKESWVYLFFSPYFVLPFAALFLASWQIRRIKKRTLAVILLVVMIQAVCLFLYSRYDAFPGNFIKNTQYFWGISVIFSCVYFLAKGFRKKIDFEELTISFIRIVLFVAASVTIFEFLYFNVLRRPVIGSFYFSNVDTSNSYIPTWMFPLRPLGICSYDQPNGFMLSSLVFLYFLYKKKMDFLFWYGSVAVFISMTGTGILSYIFLLGLFLRKPLRNFLLVLFFIGLVILLISNSNVDASSLFYKLTWDYIGFLFDLFSRITQVLLKSFENANYIFGATVPNFNVGTGISHDWGYFDVFYEQGLLGLLVYVIVYGILIYSSLPADASKERRFYYVFILLVFNFHYSSLNFYVGQMLFGIVSGLCLASFKSEDGRLGSSKA